MSRKDAQSSKLCHSKGKRLTQEERSLSNHCSFVKPTDFKLGIKCPFHPILTAMEEAHAKMPLLTYSSKTFKAL